MRTTAITVAAALLLLASCISDKEYQLRRAQLANQAKHQDIYEVLTLDGPVTIEVKENGKVAVKSPNQPFREIPIPDGTRTQAEIVQHLVDIGAITFLGYRALRGASGDTTIHHNNNAAPAAQP